MDNNNIFTAKTVDEAIEIGLKTLGITLDEAEIKVIEEGKRKLFGSIKAQVMVRKIQDTDKRAEEFLEGLFEILNIKVDKIDVAEQVDGDGNLLIDVKTGDSSRVIGKRGDVLDAIQSLAGAVANIGREEYIKVVVDCENYRAQREETLIKLANKVASRAIEKGRKIVLEPMSPYERRIIHSALSENAEVKTVSEGREPIRYVAVIPNNAKPYDKGIRYGERRDDRGSRNGGKNFGDRRGGNRDRRYGGKSGERGERSESRPPRSSSGRGKREIHFGTFLGNSNEGKEK